MTGTGTAPGARTRGMAEVGGVGAAGLRAGAGEGRGAQAGRVAVTDALAGLDGPPSIVLLFCGGAACAEATAAQAAEVAGAVPVAGMTGASAVSARGAPLEDGCVALALDGAVAGTGVARRASADLRTAARAAATTALSRLGGRPATLLALFADPVSGDQAEVVAGAYDVAGPHVPLVGGGAGGEDPAQLLDGVALRDAVVAVALATPAPAGIGVAHGCRPRPGPSIATRVDGHVVQRLDGFPAEQLYLERVGLPGAALDDEAFERLAATQPLGQLELRGEVRLRHVLGRTPEGGLRCATAIPANAPVQVAEQATQTIIDSAHTAARQAIGALGARPRAALVFDCAARHKVLDGPGPALAAEAEALRGAFEETPPLAGLYTRGEIGRVRGAKGDRNHAVVVAALA